MVLKSSMNILTALIFYEYYLGRQRSLKACLNNKMLNQNYLTLKLHH